MCLEAQIVSDETHNGSELDRGDVNGRTLPRPLPEREGGQREHHCVYLFDRTTVSALPISGAATFAWQYSSHGDPVSWAGDPEFLTGWSAVADTPHGVLAVSSDGQVVLLAHDDGRICRRDAIGPLPLVRLHTFADHAAIMWKVRGQVRAVVYSLHATDLPRASLDLSDTWPLWSTFVGTDLVLITPPDVTVWKTSGNMRRFTLGPAPIFRTALDVFAPARQAATAPAVGSLLLMGGSAGVRALDLADGHTAWSWQPDEPAAIKSLRVQGGYAIAQADHAVHVLAAATGALVAILNAPTASGFPGTHIVGDALWAVVREPAEAAGDERLVLRTVPVGISQTQPARAPAHATGPLPLGPADAREILWPTGQVVVVAPNALRAYRLP